MNALRIVRSPELPPPGGHYSQAVMYAGLLYISGQLGRGPGLSDEAAGDITAQTRRALAAVEAIARAAGSDLSQLIKVTVYISDVAHWPAVNAEYARILGEHRPARAIVPVGTLHYGALVEIDAIAAVAQDPADQ